MTDNMLATQRRGAPLPGTPGIHSPPPGPARRGAALPRWPLALIASPAAVAVWSGWVGLGGLCGFGEIHPLPGIWDSFQLNTAITLPIGIESYGAYALAAWLVPGTGAGAREFARKSAVGALSLGMAGQIAYHLLAAAHARTAPWWVTMLVSCLPVATLALATALTHLLRTDTDTPDNQTAPRLPGRPLSAQGTGTIPTLPGPAGAPPVSTAPPGRPDGRASASRRSNLDQRRPGRDVADVEVQAAAELSADPHLSGAELARRLGVGERRGQRLVNRLAPQLPRTS